MSEIVEVSADAVVLTDTTLQVVESPAGANTVEVGYTLVGQGDKFYSQSFLNEMTVTVTHNLAKFPAVSAADSFGDIIWCDVVYNNSNTLTINFSAPTSGTVYCN